MDTLLSMMQHATCYVTKISLNKYQKQLENFNYDQFRAKNVSNVYYLRTLSVLYFDCEVMRRFKNNLKGMSRNDPNLTEILNRLGLLYGLYRLEPNLSLLYESNYFHPIHQNALTIIREKILILCNLLKKEMVSLVDVSSINYS